MRDTGTVTTQTPTPVAAPARKRGREGAGDMIRSLGVVMILVAALWFFAQPSPGDARKIRDVDPSADITAFRDLAPGAPVPGAVPAGWHATSSTLGGDPVGLRIGFQTADQQYAEYAAFSGTDEATLASVTGSEQPAGSVVVDGLDWTTYRDADGSLSIVRRAPSGVTVVLGTKRATAELPDLQVLAAALRG